MAPVYSRRTRMRSILLHRVTLSGSYGPKLYIVSDGKQPKHNYYVQKHKLLHAKYWGISKILLQEIIREVKSINKKVAISRVIRDRHRAIPPVQIAEEQVAMVSIASIAGISSAQRFLASLPESDLPEFIQQNPALKKFSQKSGAANMPSVPDSQAQQLYDESIIQQTVRQLGQDSTLVKRYLDALSAFSTKKRTFSADEEALMQRLLVGATNIVALTPCSHDEASSISNDRMMAADIKNLPKLHLDLSQKRAVITLTAEPRNSSDNRRKHPQFATAADNCPFRPGILKLPQNLLQCKQNQTDGPKLQTVSNIDPRKLSISFKEGRNQQNFHRLKFNSSFGKVPTLHDNIIMASETAEVGGPREKSYRCPWRSISMFPDRRGRRLRSQHIATPFYISKDVDYSTLIQATVDVAEIRKTVFIEQKMVEKATEVNKYREKVHRYFEALQQSSPSKGLPYQWFGPACPPVSSEEMSSLQLEVNDKDKEALINVLIQEFSKATPALQKELGDYDTKALFEELQFIHTRLYGHLHPPSLLAFDPAYSTDDTGLYDTLMSVLELEKVWEVFEGQGYSEPLLTPYEPIKMNTEPFAEDHDSKDKQTGHSKRRRISFDSDVEPQSDSTDLDLQGNSLAVPNIGRSQMYSNGGACADSPCSDNDIFLDFEDEISLIRTTPLKATTSISAAAVNRAVIYPTDRSSGPNTASNSHPHVSSVPIFRALGLPANALFTQQTADPAGVASHSSTFKSSAATSLSWGESIDSEVTGSNRSITPSSFSTVDVEDTIMEDQFEEGSATHVPGNKVSSTIQKSSNRISHSAQDGYSIPTISAGLAGWTQANYRDSYGQEIGRNLILSNAAVRPPMGVDLPLIQELVFSSPSVAGISSSIGGPPPSTPSKTPVQTAACMVDRTSVSWSPSISVSSSRSTSLPPTHSDKTCPKCNKTYKHNGYLKNHIRLCLGGVDPAQESSPLEPSPGIFQCAKCGKFYKKKGNLQNHQDACDAGTTSPLSAVSAKRSSAIKEGYRGSGVLPSGDATDEFGRPFCEACNTAFSTRLKLERHIGNTCKILRAQGVYDVQNSGQKAEPPTVSFKEPLSAADFENVDINALTSSAFAASTRVNGKMRASANKSTTKRVDSKMRYDIGEESMPQRGNIFPEQHASSSSGPPTGARTLPHPGIFNNQQRTMTRSELEDYDEADDTDDSDDEGLERTQYSISPTPGAWEVRDLSLLSNPSLAARGCGPSSAMLVDTPASRATTNTDPQSVSRLLTLEVPPAELMDRTTQPTRRKLFSDVISTPAPPLDTRRDPFVNTPPPPPPLRHAPTPLSAANALSSLGQSGEKDHLTLRFTNPQTCTAVLRLLEEFALEDPLHRNLKVSCPHGRIVCVSALMGIDLVKVVREVFPGKFLEQENGDLRFDPRAVREREEEEKKMEMEIGDRENEEACLENGDEKAKKKGKGKAKGRGWNLKKQN